MNGDKDSVVTEQRVNRMKIVDYLKEVKAIPEWDRVPAISNTELNMLLNLPPWNNPESECYGCKKHSLFDCETCGENHMTVSEYNNEFLPRIDRAREFISLFESSIRHMDDKVVDKNEVYRQFKIRCWSEETKQTILTALEYYQKREGLDKICGSQKKTS